MQTECTDVRAHVDHALDVLRAIPHGPAHGRPLSLSDIGVNPAENSSSPDHYLRMLLGDVAAVVGGDFVRMTDPALLEQFCIMSVHRGEPGGQILTSLLNAFLRAYAAPSQSEAAVALLFDLANLTAVQDDQVYVAV